MEEIVHRTCTICEATCGLRITVEDGHPTRIEGDAADPFSRGHICPKAHGLLDLQNDPDRLRRPIRREGDRWVEIGWQEAWEFAATGLAEVRDSHGVDAIALYRGNPTVHDMASLLYWNVVQQAIPTVNKFSAGSIDTWPRYVQAGSMFGGMLHIPVPDLERTDHLLILGANPIVSNGSLMTAPDVKKRLREIRTRGGKIIVVDPRLSETAEVADEHHFIVPGGDAAFALALIHTLFDEGLADPGRLAGLARGFDRLPRLVADYAPESVAPACGIEAERIRRIAREFAAAQSAACYGRMGTCVQQFGSLACWAIELLNIVTGNLDEPGGVMFTRPAASLDFAVRGGEGDVEFGRHRSRVGGHDEIFGELPVAALAEEIEAPGKGQVRALLTIAGNPASSFANSGRLGAALASLDFMVAIDFYVNETTRHADLIIPPTASLEHETYDVALNHFTIRNVAKFSPPAALAEDSAEPVWRTCLELSKRMMGLGEIPTDRFDDIVLGQFAERVIQGSRWAGEFKAEEIVPFLGDESGPLRVLDLLLRTGHYGDGFGRVPGGLTLESLRAAVHGVDLGPLQSELPGKLATASGQIELAPDRILEDLPRLEAWVRARTDEAVAKPFLLIGRRDPRSMNSWLHNLPSLAKGRSRCTLQLCQADGEKLGISTGDAVVVESRVGRLSARAEISERMMPGVVSLPHGFGHDVAGVKMGVASRREGVNANLVVDDAPVDVPSGTSVLNGIPVSLSVAS